MYAYTSEHSLPIGRIRQALYWIYDIQHRIKTYWPSYLTVGHWHMFYDHQHRGWHDMITKWLMSDKTSSKMKKGPLHVIRILGMQYLEIFRGRRDVNSWTYHSHGITMILYYMTEGCLLGGALEWFQPYCIIWQKGGFLGGALEWFQRSYIIVMSVSVDIPYIFSKFESLCYLLLNMPTLNKALYCILYCKMKHEVGGGGEALDRVLLELYELKHAPSPYQLKNYTNENEYYRSLTVWLMTVWWLLLAKEWMTDVWYNVVIRVIGQYFIGLATEMSDGLFIACEGCLPVLSVWEGVSARVVRLGGVSVRVVRLGGVSVRVVRLGGVSVRVVRLGGVSARVVRLGGVSARVVRLGGCVCPCCPSGRGVCPCCPSGRGVCPCCPSGRGVCPCCPSGRGVCPCCPSGRGVCPCCPSGRGVCPCCPSGRGVCPCCPSGRVCLPVLSVWEGCLSVLSVCAATESRDFVQLLTLTFDIATLNASSQSGWTKLAGFRDHVKITLTFDPATQTSIV